MSAPAQVVGPSPSGGGPVPSVRHLPRRPDVSRTYITAREVAVLRHAANGATNHAIASSLGIGEEAVASRLRSAFRKLRVRDRTQAVAVALRLRLLDLDDDVLVPVGANHGYGDAPARRPQRRPPPRLIDAE